MNNLTMCIETEKDNGVQLQKSKKQLPVDILKAHGWWYVTVVCVIIWVQKTCELLNFSNEVFL